LLKIVLTNLTGFGVVNETKGSVKKDWIEGEFDKDK
jgi:hypothetical protein